MRTNPMVKPQISSGWAVALTVISGVCLVIALRLFLAQPSASTASLVFVVIAIVLAGVAVAIWCVRIRLRQAWIAHAVQQWEHFSAEKSRMRVTTEVTVLDIHSTDPLGAWVTLRWDHFGHIQRAWVEALPDEIWRDSVLLISPDPSQIRIHGPWPDVYYLMAADYHAFAAAEALPYLRDPKYQSCVKAHATKH